VITFQRSAPSCEDDERPAITSNRPWPEAASATISRLTADVRRQAKAIDRKVEEDAVHDMRTATRRLRTAITVYRDALPKNSSRPIEKVLRRAARRLGAVRDLDVLIKTLDEAGDLDHRDLRPLRDAWKRERHYQAERLDAELDRRRFRRALDAATESPRSGTSGVGGRVVARVADRAPGLIWTAFGEVLVYDIDPGTADPALIHEMRIAAKKLRYTLEAFEDAFDRAQPLIAQVTALQDAGGEMHDAIVARDRARSFIGHARLSNRERQAIESFASSQDRRAEGLRPTIARALKTVRGHAFRRSVSQAIFVLGE
jgi:CHAD domain-containing protein